MLSIKEYVAVALLFCGIKPCCSCVIMLCFIKKLRSLFFIFFFQKFTVSRKERNWSLIFYLAFLSLFKSRLLLFATFSVVGKLPFREHSLKW